MARQKKTIPGLTKLPDGRWKVRATYRHPQTRKVLEKQRTLPAGRSRAQALQALEEARADLRAGLALPTQALPEAQLEAPPQALPEAPAEEPPEVPTQVRLTVTDFAVEWLTEGRVARASERTVETYTEALTRHILPELGHLYVDEISRRHVEQWCLYAEKVPTLCGGTYANATVKKWWRCLCTMLRDMAADYGLPDPTLRVRPPRRPRTHGEWHHETRALRWEKVRDVLEHVKAHHPFYYPAICLLAWTGMRDKEARSLLWTDVDLGEGIVTIDTTKTAAAREVPLTPELVDVLRAHREWLIRSQHPGLVTGLAFPAQRGKMLSVGRLRTILVKTREALGIETRVTPHVLRRSLNTSLRRAGADRIVQRAMLGHSSEAMTELYDGTDIEDKRSAMAALPGQREA